MEKNKIIDLGNDKIKEVCYDNGLIYSENYYLNGKLHREDGPASIWYYKDGTISSENYYLNGKPHREAGPVVIWYNKDGTIKSEYYYLNGEELTKKEFEKHLLKKKLQII